MTIIWCGGEDIDFPNVDLDNYPSRRDTNYSRYGIQNQSYAFSKSTTTFSGITSGWLHCLHYPYNTYTTPCIIGLFQSSDNKGICVGTDDSTKRKLNIRKYDGSSYTILATESGQSILAGNTQTIDVYFSGIGSNDNIKLYLDKELLIDYTGDLSVSGMTALDSVYLFGYNSTFGPVSIYSEIIVADVDTRLMHLKTLAPNAAGDLNEWTGSYTDIDETLMSDADVIYTQSAEDNFQCNLTNTPTGTFKVKAARVVVSATDAAAAFSLKVGVKTNSAVHLGSPHSLPAVWKAVEKIYQNNPETSSEFTSTEIDNLQLAIRSTYSTTTTTTT